MSYHAVGALRMPKLSQIQSTAIQTVTSQRGDTTSRARVHDDAPSSTRTPSGATKTLLAHGKLKIVEVVSIPSQNRYDIRFKLWRDTSWTRVGIISWMATVNVIAGQTVLKGEILGQRYDLRREETRQDALARAAEAARKRKQKRLPTAKEEATIPLSQFDTQGLWKYRFDWIGDKLVMYKHADLNQIVYFKVKRFKTDTTRQFYDRWKGAIQGRFVKYNRPGSWDVETARLARNLRKYTHGGRPLTSVWISTQIYFGMKPFETFRDQKGKRWGFFYNDTTDTLIIKRHTPAVSLWSKIGKAIKEAIGWLWEKVKDLFKTLCKFLTQGSSSEAVEAAKAIAISSGNPYAMAGGAAVEVAQTICGGGKPQVDPRFGPDDTIVGMPWWTLPAVIGVGGLGYYLMTRK